MIKNYFKIVLPALLFAMPLYAQKKIASNEIVQLINQGKSVNVNGAIITGTLDFTEIATKNLVNNEGSTLSYKSKVNVPIVFRDCIFKGDLIAYKVLEKKGENNFFNDDNEIQVLYTADFTRKVIFESCTFKGKALFKYSDFVGEVSFASTEFSEEANFKYAQFYEGTDFSDTRFYGDANFKYAQFRKETDFSSAKIEEKANFKYAEFEKSVNFQQTRFDGFANFKYSVFKQSANFDESSFNEGKNFEYTTGNYRF